MSSPLVRAFSQALESHVEGVSVQFGRDARPGTTGQGPESQRRARSAGRLRARALLQVSVLVMVVMVNREDRFDDVVDGGD